MYSHLNLCIDNLRYCNIKCMIVSILLSAGILAENYAISIMICAQGTSKIFSRMLSVKSISLFVTIKIV